MPVKARARVQTHKLQNLKTRQCEVYAKRNTISDKGKKWKGDGK